jgi:glycosyltransferase involved in cell wall biosynthesis
LVAVGKIYLYEETMLDQGALSRTTEISTSPELTILMPCLNEEETIGVCISKALDFLERSGVDGEVLIADNGSVDSSIAIATRAGARVVHVPEKGYGGALMGGIAAARGRYIIMGDADDSYDFSSLEPFIEKLRSGYDLVMGNRFQGGIFPGAMPLLHRYLGNPVLSFIGRLFFKIPVRDFHCGLRGFSKISAAKMELTTTGMEFASEMIVKSYLNKLQICEVPTTLKPDGRSRAPHLKTWRDGWRHLKFLLMYNPKWLFFYPGLFLLLFGSLLGAALLPGPIEVGKGLVLNFNSFLTACLTSILGTQLITFGAFARYYASITGILPRGIRSERIIYWCKTDRLILLALLLFMFGSTIFVISLIQWAKVDFGALTNPIAPRLVASGLSIAIIGVQTAFSAFLFGILDIPTRQNKIQ